MAPARERVVEKNGLSHGTIERKRCENWKLGSEK
jgi:hypothetical protein